jgi:leucyl-tRNA synthetase
MWERMGREGTIFQAHWPDYDEALAAVDRIEFVVQVNGKVRGRLNLPVDVSEQDALAAAIADANINRFMKGAPRKVIFVPGRLLNLVA